MAWEIACMSCNASLKVPEKLQGKVIRCPYCQQPTRVPSAPDVVPAAEAIQQGPPPMPVEEIDAAVEELDRSRLSKPANDDKALPGKRRRHDDDDDDDGDEPRSQRKRDDNEDVRPRKKTKKRSLAKAISLRLGVVALVAAGVLGFFTYAEGTLSLRSSVAPEEIKLKDLIARGPDGNPNLIVTDYALCNNYVDEANKDTPDRWTCFWVPIVPGENAGIHLGRSPSPSNVKALLFSLNVRNKMEIAAKLEKPKLRVLVNPYTSLTGETRDLLKKEYSETEFEKCIILQEGRTPWDRKWIYLMAGGCVLMVVVSVVLFVAGSRR